MTEGTDIRRLLEAEGQVAPRRSLADEAARVVRELILLEKLAPGTPVPERELADGLGISRTPMKEALRTLENEGLVEYSATRRPRVADPSLEELAQYITVLGALEALAGEIACAEATDAEIARILTLESEMLSLDPDAPPLTFFHLDMAFHAAIVDASRNAPLAETHRQYNARLWRARFLSSRQADRRDNTLSEHRGIAEALAARSALATATALRDHLKSTISNISRIRGVSA